MTSLSVQLKKCINFWYARWSTELWAIHIVYTKKFSYTRFSWELKHSFMLQEFQNRTFRSFSACFGGILGCLFPSYLPCHDRKLYKVRMFALLIWSDDSFNAGILDVNILVEGFFGCYVPYAIIFHLQLNMALSIYCIWRLP